MDENHDMYIIVAEQKDDSTEMVLNVYDISCNTAENEISAKIEVDNEDEMLNKVFESLATYKEEESDNKEGILDALQNKLMIGSDEHFLNVVYDDSIRIKQELEEAELYMEQNIIEENVSNIDILDEHTKKDLIEENMCINELESFETNQSKDDNLSAPDFSDTKSYERKLANNHWLKLRKLLRNEGVMVNTKKEVTRKDVMRLVSPDNDNRNNMLQMIGRILELQVPGQLELETCVSFLNDNGYFQCHFCPLKKSQESLIQQHYRLTHGPRYLFCLACDTAFRRTAHLVRHELNCSGALAPLVRAAREFAKLVEPPAPRNAQVPCQICCKMIRRSNMPVHLRVHTNEFPFQCSLCPATFRSANTCLSHERAHRGLRPYKCPHCPRAYTSRTSLQTHKETHVAAGFACSICSRSFNRKYTLMKHMDTHTGELRYLCTLCGRGLSSKAALSNHMRLHTGAPAPHKCTECGRRFPKVYLLRAHMEKKHAMHIVTRKMFFNFLPQMGTENCEIPTVTEEDCDDPEPYNVDEDHKISLL